jgi:hypothetical protein
VRKSRSKQELTRSGIWFGITCPYQKKSFRPIPASRVTELLPLCNIFAACGWNSLSNRGGYRQRRKQPANSQFGWDRSHEWLVDGPPEIRASAIKRACSTVDNQAPFPGWHTQDVDLSRPIYQGFSFGVREEPSRKDSAKMPEQKAVFPCHRETSLARS